MILRIVWTPQLTLDTLDRCDSDDKMNCLGLSRAFQVTFTCALLMVSTKNVDAQSTSSEIVAQLRYEEGIEMYQGGQYEEALRSFRAAFELHSSPNARLFIARCLREMGQFDEAVSEYHLAAREAEDLARVESRYEATRVAAVDEREAILDRVGWILVHTPNQLTNFRVDINGASFPQQALGVPLAIAPGVVAVHAEAEGCRPFHQTVTVAAGERVEVDLAFQRIVQREETSLEHAEPVVSRQRVSLVIAASLSGVLAVGAAAAGGALVAQAHQRFDVLWETCGGNSCSEELLRDIESGQSLEVSGYVLVGVAALFMTSTTVLAVFAARAPHRQSPVQPRMSGIALLW